MGAGASVSMMGPSSAKQGTVGAFKMIRVDSNGNVMSSRPMKGMKQLNDHCDEQMPTTTFQLQEGYSDDREDGDDSVRREFALNQNDLSDESVSAQASGRSAFTDASGRIDHTIVDPRVEGAVIGSRADSFQPSQREVLAQFYDEDSSGNLNSKSNGVSNSSKLLNKLKSGGSSRNSKSKTGSSNGGKASKADPRVEGFVIGQ
jgi:hypothetical protein